MNPNCEINERSFSKPFPEIRASLHWANSRNLEIAKYVFRIVLSLWY